MTAHHTATDTGNDPAFTELVAEVMANAERFGHREHLHVTWLAIRRHGVPTAIDLVSKGIQHTARYQGVPQKYNATVSRAWAELVGHHLAERGGDDFDNFAIHHAALIDKRLLTRFYHPATLASQQARTGWVGPDLNPFPWQHQSA